jgi:hypothetical protein
MYISTHVYKSIVEQEQELSHDPTIKLNAE